MTAPLQHQRACHRVQQLGAEALELWQRLESYTVHPLHRFKASELFLEVLALQDSGTEVDWPSVFCAITTLTRLDKECLQARLAVGCSELEFRWMLHDRHLYTVHKVPVRFQRCLACMVAKQGPCGDHKATWLCRSRLTDAAPGVDVHNAHCLRPSRQRAYQMTDPHNKKSSSSGPGQDRSELISMYDSQTWPETRRSETFHSQAAKLWEFVTEQLGIEDCVQLWEIVSRASSKRYLLMMAKLWHRSSVPEDRVAMDSYVLHAPEDLPEQAIPAGEESLPGQPFKEREGFKDSWMYPTQELLSELREELDLGSAPKEGQGSSLGHSRYKRPWHWLPEMSTHPRWCKMVLPKPLKLKRNGQDPLDGSSTPLLSQELSRHGRKRRLTSAMTDLLHGSGQAHQSSDDPPYGERCSGARTPPRTRAPSKRTHAKRANELLAAQLLAESQGVPQEAARPDEKWAHAGAHESRLGSHGSLLMSNLQEDWKPARFAAQMAATPLSPSGSTHLTHLDSNDLSVSPSGLSMSSSLSTNSITTNLGHGFLGTSPSSTAPRIHAAEAFMGPNPMADWLPQLPVTNLAAHLGQIRTEMQRVKLDPVDAMEGLWGFDEFPPVPGNLEGNMDSFSLPVDCHGRSSYANQHMEFQHRPVQVELLATPPAESKQVNWQSQLAAFLGTNTGIGQMI